MKRFPNFSQLDAMDFGPASLKIIAKYYGKNFLIHSKLNNYPYHEYGYLEGKLASIPNVASLDYYFGEVDFGKILETSGVAEISLMIKVSLAALSISFYTYSESNLTFKILNETILYKKEYHSKRTTCAVVLIICSI